MVRVSFVPEEMAIIASDINDAVIGLTPVHFVSTTPMPSEAGYRFKVTVGTKEPAEPVRLLVEASLERFKESRGDSNGDDIQYNVVVLRGKIK